MIEEKTPFNNLLQKEKRERVLSLDKFLPDEEEEALVDQTKTKRSNDNVHKWVYVHFRNRDDMANFCERINQMIPHNKNTIYYPLHDPNLSLFDDDDEPVYIDKALLKPSHLESKKEKTSTKIIAENKWRSYWWNMPEYIQENNPAFRSITVKFRTAEDYKNFQIKIDQEMSDTTKSIWHPKLEITKNSMTRWVEDDNRTDPRYPLYIVSKGRYDSMITSKSLNRMKVKHHIVIEPQEKEQYEAALEKFGITYATLVIAPFSNHGDGSGRARNYAWDHSMANGHKWHWVMDDNIADFYRLHKNLRARVESGVCFAAMEDFADRFENVMMAGPHYRFFVAANQSYPAFVPNTRLFSCILIRNDCPHKWRGRYNEDVDLSLRVLKDGYATIQFNAFLQGKMATQTVAGGNTTEIYNAEPGKYNSDGTIEKSRMLVDNHPDVARLVWRYGRWHHWVDFSPFKNNPLIYKKDVVVTQGINEYNMRLETNFTL